jgi:hypothetical protein
MELVLDSAVVLRRFQICYFSDTRQSAMKIHVYTLTYYVA